MNIEEKARAYDEALEIANAAYKDEDRHLKATLERIFPELKESEDEKIRKELITHCRNTRCVTEEEAEKIAKWSPQEESCICQLESLVKEQWRQAEEVNNAVDIKKMQELMFFLKTLNPNKKPQRMISAEAKEAMYDKPACAWSEEDEYWHAFVAELLYGIEDSDKEYETKCRKAADWFKSLKQRYAWKPSDEQTKALHDLNLTGNISYAGQGQTLIELYNDLKKLTEE